MGSSTNNRSLYKPSEDEEGWATNVNANFDELDSVPEYDDVSNAPNDDGFLIYITGDGATTPEGLYQRQSGSYVEIDTDTRADVSDSGTLVVSDTEDINFATDLSVTDDGDGSVTVDATGSSTDTRTDVSDSGTLVVSDTEDINFASNLSVTDDGDGSVSVDASGSGTDLSNGHGLTGPGAGHSTFSDGLSNAEIDRFSLASGEILEVYRLAAPLQGGGTEANFTVEVYDETAASVLASVTGGGLTRISSPGSGDTSGDGNEVIIRVSNSSGSVVDASIQHRLNITDA